MTITIDGTNGITNVDGSAANPAYKQQDSNTGLSGSADQLVLSTAGTERVRVASAGQLGIAGANYGTDGQVLTSTGASSAPAWENAAGGLWASYAVIWDRKSSGTDGGTFTTGAWRTRDLTHVYVDPDNIVTLSSNQFTLGAGTYFIKWSAPAADVAQHATILYNITDSQTESEGSTQSADASVQQDNRSEGSTRIVLTGSKAFEIQHMCGATSGNVWGFGSGQGGKPGVYTWVEIYKEA